MTCQTKVEPFVESFKFDNTPFANQTIRITPNRKYASVIDFIRIVSNAVNPKCVWASLKNTLMEMDNQKEAGTINMVSSHQFNGERQRQRGHRPRPIGPPSSQREE
jgi:hypothetical protein